MKGAKKKKEKKKRKKKRTRKLRLLQKWRSEVNVITGTDSEITAASSLFNEIDSGELIIRRVACKLNSPSINQITH